MRRSLKAVLFLLRLQREGPWINFREHTRVTSRKRPSDGLRAQTLPRWPRNLWSSGSASRPPYIVGKEGESRDSWRKTPALLLLAYFESG
jgi:hypothetical protein